MPEHAVRDWVKKFAPDASPIERLLAAGDEASLRQARQLDPSNVDVAVALGELLRTWGRLDEAEAILEPLASAVAVKTVLARIRLERGGVRLDGDIDLTLEHLLDQSVTNPSARENLLQLLDALGPEDPRYVGFRRRLASRLY